MPNWCNNSLKLEAKDPIDIQKILSFMMGYNMENFNKDKSFKDNYKEISEASPYKFRYEEEIFNCNWLVPLLKFDVNEQYNRWGTKWGPVLYDEDQLMQELEDVINFKYNDMEMFFDTAWGPLDKYIKELVFAFGDKVKITNNYLETGMGFCGKLESCKDNPQVTLNPHWSLYDLDDAREIRYALKETDNHYDEWLLKSLTTPYDEEYMLELTTPYKLMIVKR